jgi:hypothetical protein
VTDFYDFDSANERLPELTDTLRSLQSLKADVVRLRDRIVELSTPVVAGLGATADGLPPAEALAESQRLKLRMQGLVDQMIATVARIDDWSIQLREIETGLVDFPALVAGRQVWLCWRLGEDKVEFWHELQDGFSGRRGIEDLA